MPVVAPVAEAPAIVSGDDTGVGMRHSRHWWVKAFELSA